MSNRTQLVQDIYANFGRGDIPAILDRFAESIDFSHAGSPDLPYAKDRRGKQQAAGFFADLVASVDVASFEPLRYVEQGDEVVAFGRWSGRARNTGKAFEAEWIMIWLFDGDKVVRYRGFDDTLRMSRAFMAQGQAGEGRAQERRRTIESIYQAFGRRDVPAILAHLAPDVRWQHWTDNSAQHAGVPYMTERSGPDGAREFFKSLGECVEMRDFRVVDIVGSERLVIAAIEVEYTVRATGRRLRDQALHEWTFDEAGRVNGYRNYIDTAKHIQAHGLEVGV